MEVDVGLRGPGLPDLTLDRLRRRREKQDLRYKVTGPTTTDDQSTR